jgi:hypothetical protein
MAPEGKYIMAKDHYLVKPEFTIAWWERLLKDEALMIKWLRKLQVTEYDGYADNFAANSKWNPDGNSAVEKFFIATAKDELKHSRLLVDLLRERGKVPYSHDTEPSIFWTEMDEYVDDLESCCAVFYYGERLAAERFIIIAEHKETPSDIKYFIDRALPDESYHMTGFQKLAGQRAIDYMYTYFVSALDNTLSRNK